MTIASTARKAGPLLGNGSATSFSFGFKVFATGDVKVAIADSAGVETVLTEGTHYRVSLNANQETSPGGSVTYPVSGSPLPVGSVLSIIGDLDYDQPLDLPSGGNFSPLALENQLDRQTIQIQQLREEMDRTAKLPPTSSESVEKLVDDLQRIADSADNLDSVAGSLPAVNTVATGIADVKTVATNLADVTNFSDVYYGPSASNPTLRKDGSALQSGDLYFNTGTKRLRVFDGAAWVDGPVNAGTIASYSFSGTGSQTAFTLPVDPVSENNTQVYIGGVYQQKSEYSVSGTTLTFSAAPAAGTNNIEVLSTTTLALGTTDAALVGFQQAGAGAVARTAQSKLRETVSVKDFGAVGDGVTSDQASVADAIASGFESVLVNDNAKFLVTSLENTRGVDLEGYGHIVKAITGGLQKLNSYGDKHQYVFGREYLAAFHNLLIDQSATATRKPIMVFSGDSTTAGSGVSADYQIDDLLKLAGEEAGLQTSYGLSSINRGQSGKNTEQWRTTYLADDLAANPDLLVLRWGINDPAYYSADPNTGPAQDAGQSAPGRRTVDDFLTSLRAGLATIRASRSLSSLSIVLMSPNSTSDTPNARDELWYEQIIPGIKQAARDYQCTFIDTYAYLRDSRTAAGVWMDNPFSNGRAIHPLNVMNTWIAGLMASVIFPEGLRQKIGRANVRNIGGSEDQGDSGRAPSYYKYGITVSRGAGGATFPFNGVLITIRSQDDIVIQINAPFATTGTPRRFAYRMGRAVTLAGNAAGWESWQILGEAAAAVTAASGFAVPGSGGMRTVQNGSVVVAEGYITMNTPGIVAANTTVATVAAGFAPVNDSFYGIATVWNGSAFETVRCRVSNPSGEIVLIQATTINANRIWLNASWTTYA